MSFKHLHSFSIMNKGEVLTLTHVFDGGMSHMHSVGEWSFLWEDSKEAGIGTEILDFLVVKQQSELLICVLPH